MSYLLGLDGSQYQGNPDFAQVKAAGYYFWLQRMTYCYPGYPAGGKIDPTAQSGYYNAKAAGLIVGGYHKVGWTDPIAEADFYIAAMSPLDDGDLLAYDIEPASDVAIPANWSEWEQTFVQRIHDRSHTWPLRYLNISMNESMPAQGVVVNCASWVAAPSFGWDEDVPVNVPVTIQQGPTAHVPGVTANVVDTDAFFGQGSTDELCVQMLKLAYHATTAAPSPAPAPEPTPVPVPEPTPVEPAPAPEPTPPPADTTPDPVDPSPSPIPSPDPAPTPEPEKPVAFWTEVLNWLVGLLQKLKLKGK